MAELTPEQLQEFETAFNQFDSDKDGRITIQELGAMMRSIGQNPTDIELKEMIEEVDQDKDNEIDFNEFVTMMMKSIHDLDSEEKTMEAFRVFDRDGSGVIRVSELKSIMMQLGSSITEAEADDLLQLANQEEGLIDYVEFVKSIFGTSKAQEHEIAS
jgi:calmodulin